MTLISIDTKVVGSSNYNEKKVLASDINQIKGALQTGSYDVKPYNIEMEGNTITADGGQNWIRRYGNTFQYYDGTWKAPATETTGSFIAGEDLAARDVVYINTSDGKIYKADTTNYDWIGIVDTAYTAGNTATVHLNNSVVGGFTGLVTGTWYKLDSTPGTIITSDLTSDNVIYNIGIAISSTQLLIIKQQLKKIVDDINKSGKVHEIYTGTGFNSSTSTEYSYETNDISAEDVGDYIILTFLVDAAGRSVSGSEYTHPQIKIEEKYIGGSYTIIKDFFTIMYNQYGGSTEAIYIYQTNSDDKSYGVKFKITGRMGQAGGVTGGHISNIQTIIKNN